MMKTIPVRFLLKAILVGTSYCVSANVPEFAATETFDISSSSEAGRRLLRHARSLENGEYQYSFMGEYAIRYQGCHHMISYAGNNNNNNNGGDDADVLVQRKQLARFRLCPANKCSGRGAGCRSNYGEYVVDLYTFLDAYVESKERARRSVCENASWECLCDDKNRDDDGDVDDNFEYNCEYSCYKKRGLKDCLQELEREQYERNYGRNENEFRLEEYARECREYGRDRRKLNDNNNNNYGYYIGPYCAKQGGNVYLGMFSDDTCTNFADNRNGESTYKQLTGSSLPYRSTSIVGKDCVSCVEPERYEDRNDDGNDDDSVEISDGCMEMYRSAGKCETNMNTDYPTENACGFVSGLQALNEKGVPGKQRSGVITFFTLFFAAASIGLASYSYYLYKKLFP